MIRPFPVLAGLFVLFLFARPTLAFGAGNIASISKVEGQNWRHGDIEDTLLRILMARAVGGKKFDKLMVSRVYFGNWLRDYSQAIDVGTVKSVSAEAIRLLLCVLGFLSFGYGSREFEVTADRLGCYRPEDHIDNPKNYADNEDARQYDRRLRGPIDERVELAVDEETGMKNYIANENVNIMTSALHVRRLFGKCIELGRSYQRSRDKTELHEALRLLGTGLHCLEDFLAHSNYIELALIELGERDVFPHVGRRTQTRIRGARHEVYPCVTGTFGGVDFLHSVTGEVSDKLTQNEIDELEGTLQNSSRNDTSLLQNLLDKIPSGLFGGDDEKQKLQKIQSNANNAQMENMNVSPRDPEEFTRYIQQVFQQIMPAIELHDEILMKISEAIEQIPVLPKLIEELEEQLSVFVFSIMAPFVVPLIQQIRNELQTGSSEIIQSSKNEQHIVFDDDNSTDPTHSMLSKDHFSNILNEIAGRTASKVLEWVVPQLMQAWDDHNVDVDRTLNRIIYGVLHHPAQRDQGEDGARDGRSLMFRSVEEWWSQMDRGEQDEYRRKLSRDGVLNGQNHKEGVHDSGHGCGKPLHMQKNFGSGGTLEDKIVGAASTAIMGEFESGVSNIIEGQTGMKLPFNQQNNSGGGRQESSGGLGGILGAVAGGLLGGDFKESDTETHQYGGRTNNGGYSQTTTEYGHSGNRYGQAEVTETQYPSGEQRTEYRRYEQDEPEQRHGRHHGRQEETTTYEERTETRWGGDNEERRSEHGRRQEESYGGRQEDSYGGRQDYGGGNSSGYGRQEESYGRRQEDSYGGRQEESYGGNSSYGRQEQSYGGRQEESYGGRQEYENNSGGGYGEERRDEERRDEDEGSGFGGLLGKIARGAEEAFGDNNGREERRW